jgi:hypothetical protein
MSGMERRRLSYQPYVSYFIGGKRINDSFDLQIRSPGGGTPLITKSWTGNDASEDTPDPASCKTDKLSQTNGRTAQEADGKILNQSVERVSNHPIY